MCGAAFAVFVLYIWIGGAALALGASDGVLDLLGKAYFVTGMAAVGFVLWRTRRR